MKITEEAAFMNFFHNSYSLLTIQQQLTMALHNIRTSRFLFTWWKINIAWDEIKIWFTKSFYETILSCLPNEVGKCLDSVVITHIIMFHKTKLYCILTKVFQKQKLLFYLSRKEILS